MVRGPLVPCIVVTTPSRILRLKTAVSLPTMQVLLGTVNEAALVPFVSGQLQNVELALALARRGNLPGAEGLVVQSFQRLVAEGRYRGGVGGWVGRGGWAGMDG